MTRKQAFSSLAGVLSLRKMPSRANEILKTLPKQKSDWELFVEIGSQHLVLQSVYINLLNAQLLKSLPADLVEYLEHIHRLNFERNGKILKQAVSIQQLLSEAGIGCIFMKGVGNIFDNLYHDLGERMVYDIDILV